jgi:release factor glutamine methyltransferase
VSVEAGRDGAGRPHAEPQQPSLGELVERGRRRLGATRRDRRAAWVVAEAAGVRDAELDTVLDRRVGPDIAARADAWVERLAGGEPVQYVLGHWPFRRLDLIVDRRVLIPRPETEALVDVALGELRRLAAAPGAPQPPVAVDLGTGSGAVALSLAAEGPAAARLWATDASSEALAVAAANRAALAAQAGGPGGPDPTGRVTFAVGEWFEALPGSLAGGLSLAVSNPPYVSEGEWAHLDPVVRDHEPRAALVAGTSGSEALERIIDESPAWLAPDGALVLELAPHQAGAMAARARRRGFTAVTSVPDLSGRPRVLVARHG